MNAVKHLTLALGLLIGLQAARGADPLPSLTLAIAFPNLKFNRPLWMEEVPDGSKRVIVIEQAGKVFIFPCDRSAKDAKTFLDLTPRKPQVQNEEGLLAF